MEKTGWATASLSCTLRKRAWTDSVAASAAVAPLHQQVAAHCRAEERCCVSRPASSELGVPPSFPLPYGVWPAQSSLDIWAVPFCRRERRLLEADGMLLKGRGVTTSRNSHPWGLQGAERGRRQGWRQGLLPAHGGTWSREPKDHLGATLYASERSSQPRSRTDFLSPAEAHASVLHLIGEPCKGGAGRAWAQPVP